jgi:hypothetical protein
MLQGESLRQCPHHPLNKRRGANSHLVIIMPANNSLACVSQAFDRSVQPGNIHVCCPTTQTQITVTNQQYAANPVGHTLYCIISKELKKKILAAILNLYSNIVANNNMVSTAVTCAVMLSV